MLVGTQMVAKGHDFRRITLVAAVQPDSALYSSDYRAPERLFCLLMQAAGRAGRDAQYVTAQDSHPEMWIQSHDAQNAVYAALRRHDYPAFAKQQQLQERLDAGMPPYAFQAIVRADARTQEAAQAYLLAATQVARVPTCLIWTKFSSTLPSPWRCSAWPMWSAPRCCWKPPTAAPCCVF